MIIDRNMADTAQTLIYESPFNPFNNLEGGEVYSHITPGKGRYGGFDWTYIEGSYGIEGEQVYGVHMRRIRPDTEVVDASTFYVLGLLKEGIRSLPKGKTSVSSVPRSKRMGIERVIETALTDVDRPVYGTEVIFRD